MALGGGIFTGQSKTLPGAYVNFASLRHASASLSERGSAGFAFELDWGVENEIFEVASEDFISRSLTLFGYDYGSEKLKGLRDLFRNVRTLYAYRLNSNGEKAACEYARARYSGVRGNDLRVVVGVNAEDGDKFDVKLFLADAQIDKQTVSEVSQLVDNEFVLWDKGAMLDVTGSEGVQFSGGDNGGAVTTSDYQKFLSKLENYAVNAVGVVSENPAVNSLFASYAKRMRDENGVKFQAVVHGCAADYEGVVNVKNSAELCYWVTGVIAGCAANKSNLNKVYDGEFEVQADYTQKQLEQAIKAGEFTLHKIGQELRVLADINSLVTLSDDKGEAFTDNQTIRVTDQIANDIAVLFNTKYLGSVPNDESGRISLWADIVKHHEALLEIRAIEKFSDEDVEVSAGDTKKSVVVRDKISVVNAMAQIYMTCVIA